MRSLLPPVVLLILLTGCFGGPPDVLVPGEHPVEPWARKVEKAWPRIVLTNQAEFEGSSALKGGSAFLVKTDDGRTLVATSMHLLGDEGGVDPPVMVERFNEKIRSWKVYPQGAPESFLEADQIGCAELDRHGDLDWLILSTKAKKGDPPATPLWLAERRVKFGDRVHLVGAPKSEQGGEQQVFSGEVVEREGERFRFTIDPPIDLEGFRGAPILNAQGHVVGIYTEWFDLKKSGKLAVEASGMDAASIVHLLRQPLEKKPADKKEEERTDGTK